MSEVGGPKDRVEIRSWDPLISAARRTMDQELLGQVDHLPAERAKLRRKVWKLWLQISNHPIDAAFWTMAALCLIVGLIVAVFDWPLWGYSGAGSYDGVVLGSASAAAFGSIVFSVVGVSLAQSAQFGAGFSAVVLNRPGPWLSGFGLVLVSGAAFVLAAFDPTKSGAVTTALFVSGGIATAWVLARQVMADADPLSAAQRAAKHYKKLAVKMRKSAATSTRMHMPRVVRSEKAIETALVRRAERDFVVAPLRMLKQAVGSSSQTADLTAALLLFGASVQTFLEYASEVDGEVGSHDGLMAVVFETGDRVIDAALNRKDNEAANYAISELVTLANPPLRHPDYAAARSMLHARLSTYIEKAWSDDYSTLPASCVVALGNIAATWTQQMAWQDAVHVLETLSRVAMRATIENRRHIGMPCASQLARLLAILGSEPEAHLRRHYLKEWERCTGPVVAMAPSETIGFMRNTEPLVPGISLHTPDTLQLHLWQARDAGGGSVAVLNVMNAVLPSFAASSEAPNHALHDGLALIYCACLVAAANRDQLDDRADVHGRVLESAFGWVDKLDASAVKGQFEDSEVAELCWSILLAAAFIADDPGSVASTASSLLDKAELAGDEWELPPIDEGYMRAFYRGLQILASWPDEARRTFEERWELLSSSGGPFGSWSHDEWGLHIGGLGVAPSLNVNGVTSPSGVIATINGWWLERVPALGVQTEQNGEDSTHEPNEHA